MNTGRYKSLKRADAVLQETGYLKAWISLKTDFTTLQEPVLSGSPVIGEQYTIDDDHAWTTGKEPIALYIKADTLEATGESMGDKGSLRLKYKPKLFIKGDGPNILEVINNLLNEETILFVQDQCSPAKFIQFGCDCLPSEVEKATFTSGTLGAGGSKGYELELTASCKYFYNGTLSQRA